MISYLYSESPKSSKNVPYNSHMYKKTLYLQSCRPELSHHHALSSTSHSFKSHLAYSIHIMPNQCSLRLPSSINESNHNSVAAARSGNKSLPDSSASPYTLISKNLYHHHTHTHALFSLSLPLHIYIYMSVRFTQSVLLLRSALCIPVHASGYMPTTTPPRRKAARGEIERKRVPGWLARKHLKHVILHYTRVRARGTKGGGRARVHSGNARARAYVCVYTYRQSAVSLSLSARAFCLFRSLARRVPICLYIYLLPRALAAMYFEISELVYDYAEGKLYRAETRSERNAD